MSSVFSNQLPSSTSTGQSDRLILSPTSVYKWIPGSSIAKGGESYVISPKLYGSRVRPYYSENRGSRGLALFLLSLRRDWRSVSDFSQQVLVSGKGRIHSHSLHLTP